jgi:hypothetical protein
MRGGGGVLLVLRLNPKKNIMYGTLHRKKSFSIFPSPAGMSLTKLSLGKNNDDIYKIFLPRESFVSDILAGEGNIEKLFFYFFTVYAGVDNNLT